MLNAITLFRELPVKERLELLNTGTETCFQPGQMLFKQGDLVKHFYIVTKGAIKVSRKTNDRELILATYGRDTFFGEIALLGEIFHPFSGSAVSTSCVHFFDKDSFWRMLAVFPSIRKVVLEYMGKRMQEYSLLAHSHEKFVALGTLAAGLAHELNNPATAARRAVSQLQGTMAERYTLLLKYMEQYLTSEQMAILLKLKHNTFMYATKSICLDFSIDPLIQMDLEDRLVAWLEARGIENGWKLASNLIAAGIAPEHLEDISQQVETEVFRDLLILLETMVTEATLLNILDHGVERITELVDTVKDYTHLDRASIKQNNADIHQGIDSTLTIMSYELKKYQIVVERNYAPELPCVYGNGAALNQVWSNLIDNAIDAVGKNGKIWIRTSATEDCVIVEIADNGSGISPEVQNRIFEPFFTTKDVGKGSGIGLSLAFRVVVVEHNGDIRCFSQPGNTCFRVCLPITEGLVCFD